MHARKSTVIVILLIVVGLLLANFIIQISVAPSYNTMGTDSGTFAYCGEIIRNGGLMYRDCWDNKTPGVYYLNALAIALGGANPFAIWLFQAIWLSIAVVAFFFILRTIWQYTGLAALGSFVLLLVILYPGIYQGGNLTETYAILPIVLLMGAFWAYLRSGKAAWLVAVGVLMAAGFLLKPTYIGMGLAVGITVIYLNLRRRAFKRLLSELAILAISVLIPLVLVGAYFAINQDLYNLLFAVFMHNISYIEQGFSLHSLYGTIRMVLVEQPMAALTILAGVSGGVFLYQHARMIFSLKRALPGEEQNYLPGQMDREQALTWFMSGVFLALIFDLAFLASSGKNFGHYLQVILPGMSVILVYLVDTVRRSIAEQRMGRTMQAAAVAAIVVVMMSGVVEMAAKETPRPWYLQAFFSRPSLTAFQPSELEQYIIDHSTPDESVLVWSGHPGMNFVTQRRIPTRYIFLLHIFSPTPNGPNGFNEFLRDLKADPPALIVEQPVSSMGLPDFESSGTALCPSCDAQTMQGMTELKQYINSNYELKFSIWDWVVYQRIQ